MKKRTLGMLLCLSLLAACASPPASTAPEILPDNGGLLPSQAQNRGQEGEYSVDTGYTYQIYAFDETYIMDAQGNPISEDAVFYPRHSMDTNEERYLVRVRSEDSGEDDEYGNPIVKNYSALYDLDKNLLFDWEEISYRAAMGQLLIRLQPVDFWADPRDMGEDYQTALFNPLTGETVLDGVNSVQYMGEGCFLANDTLGRALGVIDDKGAVISGFPAPAEYFYPSAKYGFIVADNNNPYGQTPDKGSATCLLDRSFNILLEADSMNIGFVGLRGPYLIARTSQGGQKTRILSLPDLTELYVISDPHIDLQYFDGERMILRQGARPNWSYVLCDKDGKPLTGEFEYLWAAETHGGDGDAPAQEFLGITGDNACRIDRDGKVLATASLPGINSLQKLGNGLYSYQIELSGGDGEYGVAVRSGLLTDGFEVIIPAGKYEYIEALCSYEGGKATYYDRLIGHSVSGGGLSRVDLLRPDGTAVLENISYTGSVTPNRIAVMRGFSYGLIDFEGNWIAKNSVYNTLGSD